MKAATTPQAQHRQPMTDPPDHQPTDRPTTEEHQMTTTTDTTTTTAVASLTLTVEGLQRLLGPALRIVRDAGDDRLRTVEIHVQDGWVLASGTDRFRTVVHRQRLTDPYVDAEFTGALSVVVAAGDLRHLLDAAGAASLDGDDDLEDGGSLAVAVTLETGPGPEVTARWVTPRTCGTAVYPRAEDFPDQPTHPARRLTVEAIAGGHCRDIPGGVHVAAHLLGGITDAAQSVTGDPLRLWATWPPGTPLGAIGWAAGPDLIGLIMPIRDTGHSRPDPTRGWVDLVPVNPEDTTHLDDAGHLDDATTDDDTAATGAGPDAAHAVLLAA